MLAIPKSVRGVLWDLFLGPFHACLYTLRPWQSMRVNPKELLTALVN